VTRFHGPAAATEAEAAFDRVFVSRELPSEIEEAEVPVADGFVHLPALIAELFGGSRSEARRHLASGAVRLDGEAVAALDVPATDLDGRVLQVGKRRFRRLRVV
jgi:tyrosyl-tRNA synthetase